jgi:hypothetical protein
MYESGTGAWGTRNCRYYWYVLNSNLLRRRMNCKNNLWSRWGPVCCSSKSHWLVQTVSLTLTCTIPIFWERKKCLWSVSFRHEPFELRGVGKLYIFHFGISKEVQGHVFCRKWWRRNVFGRRWHWCTSTWCDFCIVTTEYEFIFLFMFSKLCSSSIPVVESKLSLRPSEPIFCTNLGFFLICEGGRRGCLQNSNLNIKKY